MCKLVWIYRGRRTGFPGGKGSFFWLNWARKPKSDKMLQGMILCDILWYFRVYSLIIISNFNSFEIKLRFLMEQKIIDDCVLEI